MTRPYAPMMAEAVESALLACEHDPAEVRRRAEAMARQMELGAQMAVTARLREWDRLAAEEIVHRSEARLVAERTGRVA